ncbi:MAG: hypothetical protein PHY94_00435 [Candidatus Omnitrophica bacterium]|nr:hypothetical protein [Candidatus Omnitrophota bacterium]
MKIVFLIEKHNYYRNFTPLIEEGLARGHTIECWHNYSRPRTGQKWYNFPNINNAPVFTSSQKPKFIEFYGNSDLKNKLESSFGLDAVVSLHAPDFYLKPQILKNCPFQWVTLLAFCDILFEPNNHPNGPKQEGSGLFFFYSDFWLKRGKEFLRIFRPDRSYLLEGAYKKYFFIGVPEFDSFKKINSEEVRRKYNIPQDKSILLYLPFPYNNRAADSAWEIAFSGLFTDTDIDKNGGYTHERKRSFRGRIKHKASCLYKIAKDPSSWECLIKGFNEPNVFKAIRKFCDKNGLFLVTKPRLKFPVPEMIKRGSDLMIWDDEKNLNPPALKELLSISKMTVSFYSFSILSSIFAGVFHLNIKLPKEFCKGDSAAWYWFPEGRDSLFNFSGVCENWEISKIFKELEHSGIERFKVDPLRKKEYGSNYLGYDDSCSSVRFFELLEKELILEKAGVSK